MEHRYFATGVGGLILILAPKRRFPCKTLFKCLGKCPNLAQLRFNWADLGHFDDVSGLFSDRSPRKLQIDNFVATEAELLKVFTGKVF